MAQSRAPISLAIVDTDKCKPTKCGRECVSQCPVVRSGGLCIVITGTPQKAMISEDLCIGCRACVKACPFSAISIVNLPEAILRKTVVFRFGLNGFQLHQLPKPRPGQILGIIGANGIGKSTALNILSGRLSLNFGRSENASMAEILKFFRGSELQNHFSELDRRSLKVVYKPQFVDLLAKQFADSVVTVRGILGDESIEKVDLSKILDREIRCLSGGELQRFAIAVALKKIIGGGVEAGVAGPTLAVFDEPTSYLDISQRLHLSAAIKNLVNPTDDLSKNRKVIVVEHDLAILDYLSDFVCGVFGQSGSFGGITNPYSTLEGINQFLAGYFVSENNRFRDHELNFRSSGLSDELLDERPILHFSYPAFEQNFVNFTLQTAPGSFSSSDIVWLLGENGMGKTTFIKLLSSTGDFVTSVKPQIINPTFEGTVLELLEQKLGSNFHHSQFQTDVAKPLRIASLFSKKVKELSGGELQRTAITLCLGKPAQLYLLDEPSTFLDVEQRSVVSLAIRRFISHTHTVCFLVEHDLSFASTIANKTVLFEGEPSVNSVAGPPQDLATGLNSFLSGIGVTLRRDFNNFRPRINKLGSQLDTEQRRENKWWVSE